MNKTLKTSIFIILVFLQAVGFVFAQSEEDERPSMGVYYSDEVTSAPASDRNRTVHAPGRRYVPGTYFVQTSWGQGVPFNNKQPVFPTVSEQPDITGCGAIAVAQILRYHQHPKAALTGTLPAYNAYAHRRPSVKMNIPSISLNGILFDWANMKDSYPSRSFTETEANAVATLMYVLRHVRKAEGHIQALVRYLGYNPLLETIYRRDYSDAEWISILKQQIDSGLPIYYHALYEDRSTDHAWVIDGYDANGNFHMNWGWNGSADGWYSINALTPRTHNFNYHQSAIINIRPASNIVLSGAGTVNNPYRITTEEQLAFVAVQVSGGNNAYNAAHYRLENNITLTMRNWGPIGTSTNPFRGVFDGNGKVISALRINTTSSNRGLFGYITGGTVKNLGLENVNIRGSGYVGGISGRIAENAVISNCYTTGTITGSGNMIGGIAGHLAAGSTIENCYSTVVVSGNEHVGGLVGAHQGSGNAARNSAALGASVTSSPAAARVGRVVGWLSCQNNIAFSGMTVNGSLITNGTANNLNGLNFTAAQIRADGTLGGRFTAANGWTVQNGRLPGFGKTLELPGHIR